MVDFTEDGRKLPRIPIGNSFYLSREKFPWVRIVTRIFLWDVFFTGEILHGEVFAG